MTQEDTIGHKRAHEEKPRRKKKPKRGQRRMEEDTSICNEHTRTVGDTGGQKRTQYDTQDTS